MSPCSVLSGGKIFTALISLSVLGVHTALSRWETRWMASRAQHRPVIMTETCCRDVVRLRSGRISVGKDTDRVWKDLRAGSHEVSRHTEYPLRPAVFLPGAAPAHYWGLCSHRGTSARGYQKESHTVCTVSLGTGNCPSPAGTCGNPPEIRRPRCQLGKRAFLRLSSRACSVNPCLHVLKFC